VRYANPLPGQHQRPGKAGSAVRPGSPPGSRTSCRFATPYRGQHRWPGKAGPTVFPTLARAGSDDRALRSRT